MVKRVISCLLLLAMLLSLAPLTAYAAEKTTAKGSDASAIHFSGDNDWLLADATVDNTKSYEIGFDVKFSAITQVAENSWADDMYLLLTNSDESHKILFETQTSRAAGAQYSMGLSTHSNHGGTWTERIFEGIPAIDHPMTNVHLTYTYNAKTRVYTWKVVDKSNDAVLHTYSVPADRVSDALAQDTALTMKIYRNPVGIEVSNAYLKYEEAQPTGTITFSGDNDWLTADATVDNTKSYEIGFDVKFSAITQVAENSWADDMYLLLTNSDESHKILFETQTSRAAGAQYSMGLSTHSNHGGTWTERIFEGIPAIDHPMTDVHLTYTYNAKTRVYTWKVVDKSNDAVLHTYSVPADRVSDALAQDTALTMKIYRNPGGIEVSNAYLQYAEDKLPEGASVMTFSGDNDWLTTDATADNTKSYEIGFDVKFSAITQVAENSWADDIYLQLANNDESQKILFETQTSRGSGAQYSMGLSTHSNHGGAWTERIFIGTPAIDHPMTEVRVTYTYNAKTRVYTWKLIDKSDGAVLHTYSVPADRVSDALAQDNALHIKIHRNSTDIRISNAYILYTGDYTYSYADIVRRTWDMSYLATEPKPGEGGYEITSRDRLSNYNEETGEYTDWAANQDGFGYERASETDGYRVLADLKGPGYLTRFFFGWNYTGNIRIYVDGVLTVDMPVVSFVREFSQYDQLSYRTNIASDDGYYGTNLFFVPITYNESCLVELQCAENEMFYYNLGYYCLEEGATVEPFRFSFPFSQASKYAAILAEANEKLNDNSIPAGTINFNQAVQAGESVTLLEAAQPGAVSGWSLNLNIPEAELNAQSSLTEWIINMYWDGSEQPAVSMSVADFFSTQYGLYGNTFDAAGMGVSEDGVLYAKWYMPYHSAKITLTNQSATVRTVSASFVTEALQTEQADTMTRFHANWQRSYQDSGSRAPDANMLYVEGKGRFVGTSLHIYQAVDCIWWGEGDEKIYIDGEKMPSWFGTGSEDYFGYTWGDGVLFDYAYCGQPIQEGNYYNQGGLTIRQDAGDKVNYRIHVLDNICFNSSIDVNIEKYFSEPSVKYAATTYFYLTKTTGINHAPVAPTSQARLFNDKSGFEPAIAANPDKTPGDFGWQTDGNDYTGWLVNEDGSELYVDYDGTNNKRIWKSIIQDPENFHVQATVRIAKGRAAIEIIGQVIELNCGGGNGGQIFDCVTGNWFDALNQTATVHISRVDGGDLMIALYGKCNTTPVTYTKPVANAANTNLYIGVMDANNAAYFTEVGTSELNAQSPATFGWETDEVNGTKDFAGWNAYSSTSLAAIYAETTGNHRVWKSLLSNQDSFTAKATINLDNLSSAYVKVLGQTVELDGRNGNGNQLFVKANGDRDWIVAADGKATVYLTRENGGDLTVDILGEGAESLYSFTMTPNAENENLELGIYEGAAVFSKITVGAPERPQPPQPPVRPSDFGWDTDEISGAKSFSGWTAIDAANMSAVYAKTTGNHRIWKGLLTNQNDFALDLDLTGSNSSSGYVKVLGVTLELDGRGGDGNQMFVKLNSQSKDWVTATACAMHVKIERSNGGNLTMTVTGKDNEIPLILTATPSEENENVELGLYAGTVKFEKINAICKEICTHDWQRDAEASVAPTCLVAGKDVYFCSKCEETKEEPIAAFGHDMVTDAAVAATCTETGLTEGSHCSRCDYRVAQEVTDALGHNMVTDAAVAATCTKTGLTEGSHCSRCDYKVAQEVTDALGHDMVTDAAVAATCTESGLTEGSHCSRCNAATVAQTVVDALGHSWDAGVITTKPTATEEGVKTFTCTRCGETMTESIPATGEWENPFKDIAKNAWYYNEVCTVGRLGLMNGMTADTFEPNSSMTRAMLVTVLWRMDGSPEPTAANKFTDLKEGNWYYKAVLWAAENGIVNGVSATTFAPDASITREQIATIFYRYAAYKKYDTTKSTALTDFADTDKVANYAKKALSWCVAEQLIGGMMDGDNLVLDPKGNATRAQVATILVRFVENIAE